MKTLMYGNEAIAWGAYLAGCRVAAAYPGTPSTEITEYMAKFPEVHAQWSTNEKVALEVAIGSSIGGARAMACMKHVGLNVASDPLMTVSYMGVNAGLVVVTCDDPGMHSSQNEQDNRWYGLFAHVPVLEPSDSEEALKFTMAAFDISERFDTVVLLRSTTRISHARSLVEKPEKELKENRGYEKNAGKYVMLPANARKRKMAVLERVKALKEFAETTDLNFLDVPVKVGGKYPFGFITGGISYQYVREAFPDAPVLKLGLSWPVPEEKIREFADLVDRLYVVEELDPFWEMQVRALGIKCFGKDVLPAWFELSPELVKKAVLGREEESETVLAEKLVPPLSSLPARPPVLCPGCPHRATFSVLSKKNLTVTGDIGCYTLGALAPLSAIDTTTCMGASIGHAQGMELASSGKRKVVAVIGDSTFLHSGITGLINMTYNGASAPVIILDNMTTAMTGHQGHPASGWNARSEPSPRVSLEEIVEACGKKVLVVNAFDVKRLEQAVDQALVDPSIVIISRAKCALLQKGRGSVQYRGDKCVGCGLCLKPGCPALGRDKNRPVVNPALCNGCGLCVSCCPRGALEMPSAAQGGVE